MAGGSTGTSDRSQRGAVRLALILVFVWVIAFTYSEDVVDAINDIVDAVRKPALPRMGMGLDPVGGGHRSHSRQLASN